MAKCHVTDGIKHVHHIKTLYNMAAKLGTNDMFHNDKCAFIR